MASLVKDSNEKIREKDKSSFLSKLYEIVRPEYKFQEWNKWQIVLFRFFFLFFVLLIIPIDWKFYRDLFSINLFEVFFFDLFQLSRYQPQFFSELPQWGLASYANWGVVIVVAILGSFVWSAFDKNAKEYTVLYYWLRVLIRYRLAIALLTYGFIKFFPLQMPYSSLSNLLTNYGDYYAWKIYFQTTGIAPKYESFLGFVEILAALLIFYRRTVTLGVGLVFGFLGNVAVANGFYDIGEHVFSSFLVLLATFLFVDDWPRLYNLLVAEKTAVANRFIPDYSANSIGKIRLGLQALFFGFAGVFAFTTYINHSSAPYKIPKTPGLANAYGLYNVKEFILNGDTLPYSKTSPHRWQDVVFEKWATMTVKVNRPVKIDKSSGEGIFENDIDRNYELAGFAGRHYFHYNSDTINQTLSLQNKNINHRDEKLSLNYHRPNDSTIVLSGLNENNDSIRVVLEKLNKKFLMFEGRRKEVKI